MIIRGGENIPVAYVENVLYEHPEVAAVAVVGVPDPRLQERACAFVVLTAGADESTSTPCSAFLAEKGVAKQYWPERLELLPELPRTASGKIHKFRIAGPGAPMTAYLVAGVRTPFGRYGGASPPSGPTTWPRTPSARYPAGFRRSTGAPSTT